MTVSDVDVIFCIEDLRRHYCHCRRTGMMNDNAIYRIVSLQTIPKEGAFAIIHRTRVGATLLFNKVHNLEAYTCRNIC